MVIAEPGRMSQVDRPRNNVPSRGTSMSKDIEGSKNKACQLSMEITRALVSFQC